MSEILNKLNDLERKLRGHIKAHDELKSKHADSGARMQELEAQVREKTVRISELEEELKVLRTAGSIHGNGNEAVVAKGRINEMVREIDKCIALLNS